MTHSRITLFDLVQRADFDAAIDAKLVNIRDDGAGLRILNYSDAAMYTPGSWENPAVRQCRGLIVDADWNVIARPWSKFFNHGQAEAGVLDMSTRVEVTDKMDGSLGIIHLTPDGLPRVASRGSFESDQAIHATAVLHARYAGLVNLDEITPLVEIVYPENRIVVNYGDLDDLILLGGVDIQTGEYIGPDETRLLVGWTGPCTAVFEYDTLLAALAADPRPGMEGLCVRYLDEPRIVKIKQDEYVRLHKIVTGLSERSIWEHMSSSGELNALLGELPDELHAWTREVWERIEADARRIARAASDTHDQIINTLPASHQRGDYAALAKSHGPLTPLLFHLLDGRDLRPSILRTLKPAGNTHAKTISEAVA